MRSKSRLALDEQGTNILYLVSGFVEWKEKNDTSSPWIKITSNFGTSFFGAGINKYTVYIKKNMMMT